MIKMKEINLISGALARKLKILPISRTGNRVVVGVSDPLSLKHAMDDVKTSD